MGMNLPPELEAKIVHAADCRCHSCKGDLFGTNAETVRMSSEKVFMAQVRDLLKACGWRHYHTHDSRKSQAGFPDIVAVRGNRLIFAELKTEKGILTADQMNWRDDLVAAGVPMYVWRPSDWAEIVKVLT